MIEWVSFFGLLVGIIARVASPYLRKLRDETIKSFDVKYLLSAVACLILCLIVSFLAFPLLVIPPLPNGPDLWFMFGAFMTNFAIGWGANDIVNEVMAWKK